MGFTGPASMAEPNIKPSNASVQMRRARLVLRGDLTRLAGLEPRTARSCSAASRPPARLAAGAHRAKVSRPRCRLNSGLDLYP